MITICDITGLIEKHHLAISHVTTVLKAARPCTDKIRRRRRRWMEEEEGKAS